MILIPKRTARRGWHLLGATRRPSSTFLPSVSDHRPSYYNSPSPSADLISNNQTIKRYLKSGLLNHADHLFDGMPHRDIISWNSIITGHARSGSLQKAISLFRDMLASGTTETPRTFPSLLAACGDDSRIGLQLHSRSVSLGFSSDPFVGSALADLYMRAGAPDHALSVFNGLVVKTTAACNSVMRGFCELRTTDELLSFFVSEMGSGVEPDGVSFSYLIKGCCCRPQLGEGKQLHCHVIKLGWVPASLFVSNAIVDLYSAALEMEDARRAIEFIHDEDIISWNSMVSAWAGSGVLIEALGFLSRMLWNGKKPSVRSFVSLLNLSSRAREVRLGVQIHGFAMKMGLTCSSVHVQSALIDMYGKCYHIASSVSFFNWIPERGLECCNSLITAFLHCKLPDDAVEMLGLMIDEGVTPDNVTFSAALKGLSSCSAALACLTSCQMLHCCTVKLGLESDEAVSCSLINAYSRSGHCESSQKIFERIEDPNVMCFSAMISGCSRNGRGKEGLEMFNKMVKGGIEPDDITFLCVLTGCDHSGMVEEGLSVFNSMTAVHGVNPDRRHYSCVANLLGRAGKVEEALGMARFDGDRRMWTSLLNSCRVHGNKKIGRVAAEMLMKLQPIDAAGCLQVSGFFSEIGDGEGLARAREMLEDSSGKEAGRSAVEVRGEVEAVLWRQTSFES